MCLIKLFHKIKIGFTRKHGTPIPYVSEQKRYGNNGEQYFIQELKYLLPECKIKQNIIINTPNGNAEIDCLILYKNKLFAIEIKRWKGDIIETDNRFVQYKQDRYTGETHTKILKSPFSQLKRSIYLLKSQSMQNIWINPIVYFEDTSSVSTTSENIAFTNITELVKYIINQGKQSNKNEAINFFNECQQSNLIYANYLNKSLNCIIDNTSLQFNINGKQITKQNISLIEIMHHWSYDTLKITSTDNKTYYTDIENGMIAVTETNIYQKYSLSKIDYIKIANN